MHASNHVIRMFFLPICRLCSAIILLNKMKNGTRRKLISDASPLNVTANPAWL